MRTIRGTYDDALRAAMQAASRGQGLLIPDTSDDPDHPVVKDVMAGYEVGGPLTTPSGAAGVAGLLHVSSRGQLRVRHRLRASSSVLLLATEDPIGAGPTVKPQRS